VVGAGLIDSVVMMGNGQVCQLDCELEFVTGASWEELSEIGAVVSRVFAGTFVWSSVDHCMLLWIEFG